MADVYTVQSDTEEGARAGLQRLCETLGLEPLMAPTESSARQRWMARAAAPEPETD